MRILISLLLLVWGVLSASTHTAFALVHFVYGAPLFFLVLERPGWWIASVTLSLIVTLPPIVFYLRPGEFVTLPPNLNAQVRVNREIFPGVSEVHRFSTDERGFRVVPKVNYDDASKYRIFAIGGSTTESAYIDDLKTWTHLLQENLSVRLKRRVEVINTGVSGLRAEQHLATLLEIRRLHPDLVIFLMGFNDWNHQIRMHHDTWMRTASRWCRILSPSDFLSKLALLWRFRRASGTPDSAPIYDDGSHLAMRRDSLTRLTHYDWRPMSPDNDYLTTLSEIGSTCRTLNVPCLFVEQTSAYQADATPELRKRFWMTPPDENYTLTFDSMIHLAWMYNRTLRRFAEGAKHPFCPTVERLRASLENFYDDCHFTEAGSRRMAELVSDCVAPLALSHGAP